MIQRAAATVALGAVALLLAGCASAATGANEGGEGAEQLGSTGAGGFEAALAAVPGPGAGPADIAFADYAAARAALGADEAGAGVDALRLLGDELGMILPAPFGWNRAELAGEVDETIGVSLADVTAFVDWQGDVGDVLAFDAPDDAGARLTAALGEPADGVWAHGEEDGGVDLSLGEAAMRSQRIAEVDGRVVIASTGELLELVREGDVAADDEARAEAARALDEREVLAAMLNRPSLGADSSFSWVGGGVSHDGGVTRDHLVWVVAEGGDVEASAERVRENLASGATADGTPFSELLEVEDVTVSGRLIIADARPVGSAPVWSQLLYRGDLG
ncbi:hypothetical protein [Agromyces sp. NPDC058064]|uniref:hypothetical protein n=1 Tax=Agromyces sp. NPDC058064 TaxID=3346322 RepID=UPI0036D784D5